MKRLNTKPTILILFLLSTFFSFGQELTREIKFDEKKQNKIIAISLTEDMKSIELNFFSKIEEGYITIKIFGPENNEKGSFLLYANKSLNLSTKLGMKIDSLKANIKWKRTKNHSGKEGQVKRIIKNPMKGRWVIKLIGEKVKGTIATSVNII